MPTCHHVKKFLVPYTKTIAVCGSTGWSFASTGWNDVDCPACLELRPTQLRLLEGWRFGPARICES